MEGVCATTSWGVTHRSRLVSKVVFVSGRRGEVGFRKISIGVIACATRVSRGVYGAIESEDRMRTLIAGGEDRTGGVKGGEGGGGAHVFP